jgi:2-iminobutanoate/2-iminopropanoate deaminase
MVAGRRADRKPARTRVMSTELVTYPHIPGAIQPTGPWRVAARGAGLLFVAGMRGIDPATNTLVSGDAARVRQAFANMRLIVESQGGTLADAVRLVVYVTDMTLHRPVVNAVQLELWPDPLRQPPRTIVQVTGLNQDDIVEVEGTFCVL